MYRIEYNAPCTDKGEWVQHGCKPFWDEEEAFCQTLRISSDLATTFPTEVVETRVVDSKGRPVPRTWLTRGPTDMVLDAPAYA